MEINVKRNDIVGEFLGQTLIKTAEFLQNHIGYTFIFNEPIVYNDTDIFGKEALDALNSLKSTYSVNLVFEWNNDNEN